MIIVIIIIIIIIIIIFILACMNVGLPNPFIRKQWYDWSFAISFH